MVASSHIMGNGEITMSTDRDAPTTIRLRLICLPPPPVLHDGKPTIFGLQNKQGRLDQGQAAADGLMSYICGVEVHHDPATTTLRFRSPYVHGPPNDPFLYLSWRFAEDDAWIRRLKITLVPITWAQIVAATIEHGIIEGRVQGTGSARVPLLGGGWTVCSDV